MARWKLLHQAAIRLEDSATRIAISGDLDRAISIYEVALYAEELALETLPPWRMKTAADLRRSIEALRKKAQP